MKIDELIKENELEFNDAPFIFLVIHELLSRREKIFAKFKNGPLKRIVEYRLFSIEPEIVYNHVLLRFINPVDKDTFSMVFDFSDADDLSLKETGRSTYELINMKDANGFFQ